MIEDQFTPDIAEEWITAFETVWATHIARPVKRQEKIKETNFSDIICRQHCDWIQTRYENKLSGELFSASDIYVPLQLIERGKEGDLIYDVEDLLAQLKRLNALSEISDWIFISGGPGSGKSMAAIHLAQEMSETDIFPIYLRGSHLSDIAIDIQNSEQPVIDSFSIQSFLQHFRASSRKAACLILDGIDEIPRKASALSQILTDLILEQNVCKAHDKRLHIIALGRPSHIEFATKVISAKRSRSFDMLGLDGRHQLSAPDITLGQDRRADWWRKYLNAIDQKADPSLPDFLSIDYDDYSDFGSDPLLTYLICRLALGDAQNIPNDSLPHEAVNALTYAKNRNVIFHNIIAHIHNRSPLPKGQNLSFDQFQSILQHIALANWHSGEGRSVSLNNVRESIFDKNTERAFEALTLKFPDMLITAFYFQMRRDNTAADQAAIEFTHKTFSEYLVSTLIFDYFEQLIIAFSTQVGLKEALINWARISCAGAHDPSLTEFSQKEAALRYEAFSKLNWDSALTLICDHLATPQAQTNGIEIITEVQRSASLCFFIWSCLNIERQKRTGQHFELFETPIAFSNQNLRQIQLPNALNFDSGSLTEPQLQHSTFLTPSLSALHFNSADLSQLSFSIGHIQSISCQKTSFAMTYWSHVKISESNFQSSIFQQAILHGCRWLKTVFSNSLFQATKFQLTSFIECSLTNIIFSQCHFSDVEFASVEMDRVTFDRCTFTNCQFDPHKNQSTLSFRHSSFLDMETSLNKMIGCTFENCMFQSSHHQGAGTTNKKSLEIQIEDLSI